MPRPTKVINTKISHAQGRELLAYIDRFYPDLSIAEYIRHAIRQEMAARGVEWAEYEFIPNDQRGIKKMTWKVGRPRKKGG